MEAKKCLYCNDEIIGKREDAKFCSNTCKAKHWEEKKLSSQDAQPIKEEKNVASQLRGVLNGADNGSAASAANNAIEPVFIVVEQKVPNLVRIHIDNEYRRLSDVRKQVDNEIQELQFKLKQINSLNGSGWIWGLTGAGAIGGNYLLFIKPLQEKFDSMTKAILILEKKMEDQEEQIELLSRKLKKTTQNEEDLGEQNSDDLFTVKNKSKKSGSNINENRKTVRF